MEISGRVLDIGGDVWSMRQKVKSFKGVYETLSESDHDLNHSVMGSIELGIYDHVFCTEVMQFVYNPRTALESLRFLLAPLGRIYLSFHLTHPPMKSHYYLRYTGNTKTA